MFTAASLLSIAEEAEARYKRLLAEHPPGTFHAERNEAHDLADRAMTCAQWMERRGGEPLAFVGPFGTLPFKKGDRVRLRRGARMFSTHPSVPREGKPYLGSRLVKVHGFDRGYVETKRMVGEDKVFQPCVRWVGNSRYWCWADANDIEFVRPA